MLFCVLKLCQYIVLFIRVTETGIRAAAVLVQSLLPPSLFLCIGFVCPHITKTKILAMGRLFFTVSFWTYSVSPINVYSM